MAFYISQFEQISGLLYALVVGILFGALYDLFRISRVMLTGKGIGKAKTSFKRIEDIIKGFVPPHSERTLRVLAVLGKIKERTVDVVIFFEDILFFVVASIFFTVFLFYANFGQLRLYIYIGAVSGFFLYYCTVARVSGVISGFAVSLVRLILFFTYYKILKPIFSIIAKAISVPVYECIVRRVIAESDREAAKLLDMSDKGFGLDKLDAVTGKAAVD